MGLFGISFNVASANVEDAFAKYRNRIERTSDRDITAFGLSSLQFCTKFIIERLLWNDSCYKKVNEDVALSLVNILSASLYLYMSKYSPYPLVENPKIANEVFNPQNEREDMMIKFLFVPSVKKDVDYFYVLSQVINEGILGNRNWDSDKIVEKTKDLFLYSYNSIDKDS